MYRSQYHIYRDKPQLYGYKKNGFNRGTKLLDGNRYSLPLDFFPPILPVFATFWNVKIPIFFPLSNSQFLLNRTVIELMFTNVGPG